MTAIRPAIFRDALQVSPERIAVLNDRELTSLMRELIRAQAYVCGADVGQVRINTEGRAKDDGADGWSPKPASPDEWLGMDTTCWQFKAGTAGEPAKLAGEVTKRIPKETLAAGGRFVVVTSGSTNGKKGEEDRLEKLRREAATAQLPTDAIVVLGSERLTDWCNKHPAVAARWAGRPAGLSRLLDWLLSDQHQAPWQPTSFLEQQIEDRRRDLDFYKGEVVHLHIQGHPGVGKTRFALELCRDAKWKRSVVYVRQATDLRLNELFDSATAEEDVILIVVADEVQPEQLLPLRDSLTRGQGRTRLITIGHSLTPDPVRIPAVLVSPLEPEALARVIKGWYPAMPQEHVDFVVRFADGYVRLAQLAANEVVKNPSIDVRDLLDLAHIRHFLDKMLGGADRRALYVVAVLSSVGWTEDRQVEGETVARHLALDWSKVRTDVERFDRDFHIVPRGGRYRYISPTPLGIYLAIEAWSIFPDRLKTLAGALPTQEAVEAYYERLQMIAGNPQAREFAREELSSFFQFADFVDPRSVRRWSALSAADPALAVLRFMRALQSVPPESRTQIAGRARREAVWTLVRLAWKSSAFHDAVLALALLAEAENETWGNNATAEFVHRFQILLGGTAVPYVDRLPVLDELLAMGRPALTALVVRALAKVGDRDAFRMGGGPASAELPELEWRPANGGEYLICIEEGVNRLTAIARARSPKVQAELVEAADKLSMLLRESPVRGFVEMFFEALREAYPEARESLRRSIAKVLRGERKYWNELPEEELAAIESFHSRFEDPSLSARLRQHVGLPFWDRAQEVDLSALATELASNQDVLSSEWSWLTSGEAGDAWRLGEALAIADSENVLDSVLPALQGRGQDLSVLCGYINKRRHQRGTEWFDDWLAAQLLERPADTQLLFTLSRCVIATDSTARMIVAALRESQVDSTLVEQLGFGRWGENLPSETFVEVLRTLVEHDHRSTVIAFLDDRFETRPDESEQWEEIALELVTSGDLIRSGQMTDYHWQEVATRLVDRHARRIAAAIFREQADREAGTWFAEHSAARDVLSRCVEADPAGVWQEFAPHLLSPSEAYAFSIGFPEGLLERMPAKDVEQWVLENIDDRAPIVARLVKMDLSSDDTMAARLLGSFGDNERVASAFFSSYVSGVWWGPASSHWNELADELMRVAKRTALPKLRRWAKSAEQSLRDMADRDHQREQEEELRQR